MLDLGRYSFLASALFCGVNYVYGCISRAAQCCNRERQSNTLELLLTTDVSGYSIVMGKSNAISLYLLPWIVCFVSLSVGFIICTLISASGSLVHVVICAVIALNLLCMVFAYEFIAMYSSLKIKNYTTATAMAGFLAWFVVGNLILCLIGGVLWPFTLGMGLIAAPIAGPILIGNHFRLRLIDEFRRLAAKGARLNDA